MYWAAVSTVPLGSNGPDTAVNRRCPATLAPASSAPASPASASWRSAAATGPGAAQTGCRRRSTMSVGLAAVCGKCRASSALPRAESLPAGAGAAPPNPAARYPAAATASVPNRTRPTASVITGRRTIRAQAGPHHPDRPLPGRTEDGQNAAGPQMASSAGSRLRPAMSIRPIAMDSGAASPEYRLNVAVASDSRAAMRIPAENVIVSPTRATDRTIASWQARPARISSRTRNIRNRA